MARDPIVALFIIIFAIVGMGALGLSAVLSQAVLGDPKYCPVVLMGMIGLSMIVGKIFVNWASGPPKPPWR